jgi:hypothetical protein
MLLITVSSSAATTQSPWQQVSRKKFGETPILAAAAKYFTAAAQQYFL